MPRFSLNQAVRVVNKHWLRSNEIGVIVGANEAQNRWLVEFQRKFPGGGLDGNKLYLEESQLEPLEEKLRRVATSRR